LNKTLTKPLLFKNLIHRDSRGHFYENFKKKKIKMNFAFSAAAYSKKNVIRGNYQCKKRNK
jgi:dTDP-4-dehydrorhamnose 3,5-epimerase-like enzyme